MAIIHRDPTIAPRVGSLLNAPTATRVQPIACLCSPVSFSETNSDARTEHCSRRDHETASHGIAHASFARAFALGDYAPGDVAISDHADRLQVLYSFDNSNLAAVVPHHHLGRLLHSVFRRAASKIGDHNILHGFALSNGELFLIASNRNSDLERLWRVTSSSHSFGLRCDVL